MLIIKSLMGKLGLKVAVSLCVVLLAGFSGYKWYASIGEAAINRVELLRQSEQIKTMEMDRKADIDAIVTLQKDLKKSKSRSQDLTNKLKEANNDAPEEYKKCLDVDLPSSVINLLRNSD